MKLRSFVAPVAAVSLALLAFATPSLADDSTSTAGDSNGGTADQLVTPFVDCLLESPTVVTASDGTDQDTTSITAVFGYDNSANTTETWAAGDHNNYFTPGLLDRGQPSLYEPGVHHGVFSVTFIAFQIPKLFWIIDGQFVSVTATSAPSCQTMTTTTLSAPATVESGAPMVLSAAVTREVPGAPTSGTVTFSVDGSAAATAAVSDAGVARTTATAPAAGDHTITASYADTPGDAQLDPSSATTSITVTPAGGLGIAAVGLDAQGTAVTLHVTRTASPLPATVDYTTADGSALVGKDYEQTDGTLTFAAGETTATISVPLEQRAAGSPASEFFVLLERASTTVTTPSATVQLPAVDPENEGGSGSGASTGGESADGGTSPGDSSTSGSSTGSGSPAASGSAETSQPDTGQAASSATATDSTSRSDVADSSAGDDAADDTAASDAAASGGTTAGGTTASSGTTEPGSAGRAHESKPATAASSGRPWGDTLLILLGVALGAAAAIATVMVLRAWRAHDLWP